jgi:prefoldin subunit 5
MTELTLEMLRAELAPLHAQLGAVQAQVDGLPLIGSAIETLRHDVRTLRAAINGMARVNITAGEVEALHADIDRMQTKQLELETRIATLERMSATESAPLD